MVSLFGVSFSRGSTVLLTYFKESVYTYIGTYVPADIPMYILCVQTYYMYVRMYYVFSHALTCSSLSTTMVCSFSDRRSVVYSVNLSSLKDSSSLSVSSSF